MAAPLKFHSAPLEVSWRRLSRSKGENFENKMFKFWWVLGLSDQSELYHTPLLSKIWGLGVRIFWDDPFWVYISDASTLSVLSVLLDIWQVYSTFADMHFA